MIRHVTFGYLISYMSSCRLSVASRLSERQTFRRWRYRCTWYKTLWSAHINYCSIWWVGGLLLTTTV